MSEPFNKTAHYRALRLIELIAATDDPGAAIKLHADGGYAHIEVASHNLPPDKVREIFRGPESMELFPDSLAGSSAPMEEALPVPVVPADDIPF